MPAAKSLKAKFFDVLKNITLLVLSVVISISVLEIAYRVIYERKKVEKPKENWAIVPERFWIEYNLNLGWYHQRNKKAFLKKNGFEIEINTNSQGFRGKREYEIEKPAGVRRIVALGDSFFFGWGVKDNETFAAKLEQKNTNLEVINLSVAGYGIDQILVAYRSIGKAYHPDIVLVGIFPEDFWRATRSFSDSGYAKPYFYLSENKELILNNVPVPKQFKLNANQFPEVIKRNPIENMLIYSSVYRSLKRGFIHFQKSLGWTDPETTVGWILGREILIHLVQEIHEMNARPILVVVSPDRWMETEQNESIYLALLRFAQRENIELIDTVPVLRQAVKKSKLTDYYIHNDGHWTERAHQLVADLLNDYFKKYGLV